MVAPKLTHRDSILKLQNGDRGTHCWHPMSVLSFSGLHYWLVESEHVFAIEGILMASWTVSGDGDRQAHYHADVQGTSGHLVARQGGAT